MGKGCIMEMIAPSKRAWKMNMMRNYRFLCTKEIKINTRRDW
jgi:hypothetical protein